MIIFVFFLNFCVLESFFYVEILNEKCIMLYKEIYLIINGFLLGNI